MFIKVVANIFDGDKYVNLNNVNVIHIDMNNEITLVFQNTSYHPHGKLEAEKVRLYLNKNS